MKRNILITLCSLIFLVSIGTACSSRQSAPPETKQVDQKTMPTRYKTAGNVIASKSGMRFWAWSLIDAGQGQPETKEIIRDNTIVSQFILQSGRPAVPSNSFFTVKVDLKGAQQGSKPAAVEWVLQPADAAPRNFISKATAETVRSQRFSIDFTDDFTITTTVIVANNSIASETLSFTVASSPTVQIVQPVSDVIAEYEETITFIANAVDGAGNFPPVIWVVKNNQVERVLGISSEIRTDRLDIGYNTVTAYAVDFRGAVMASRPVHVMIPYQAVKTRIETPQADQEFEWNQPVLFFARGNNLEYSLSMVENLKMEPEFARGSGFLKYSLPSGVFRITFRGEFGTDSHTFTVKERRRDIATATRVEGYVLMSGKRGSWQRVSSGDLIPEGYVIRAIDNGLAEIHLINGVVYILNQGNAIRILSNGNIVKNLKQEDLALYSLVDPENIREVEKNLKPMIGQLQRLLTNHEIVELEAENKEDILHLLNLIFKGQLKIDEVTVE